MSDEEEDTKRVDPSGLIQIKRAGSAGL